LPPRRSTSLVRSRQLRNSACRIRFDAQARHESKTESADARRHPDKKKGPLE
jgi:hypothetical protein